MKLMMTSVKLAKTKEVESLMTVSWRAREVMASMRSASGGGVSDQPTLRKI